MSTVVDDGAIVHFLLVEQGVRPNSPAMQALGRLIEKAGRYEWALPLLTGDDTPEAHDRTMKMAAQLLRGVNGEAAVIAAMEMK